MDLAIGMLRDQHVWNDKKQGGKLYKHLRCQKSYRKRSQTGEKRGKIPNQTSIEERPAVVEDRERLGDWEETRSYCDPGGLKEPFAANGFGGMANERCC